jgi:hypothetical protein
MITRAGMLYGAGLAAVAVLIVHVIPAAMRARLCPPYRRGRRVAPGGHGTAARRAHTAAHAAPGALGDWHGYPDGWVSIPAPDPARDAWLAAGGDPRDWPPTMATPEVGGDWVPGHPITVSRVVQHGGSYGWVCARCQLGWVDVLTVRDLPLLKGYHSVGLAAGQLRHHQEFLCAYRETFHGT